MTYHQSNLIKHCTKLDKQLDNLQINHTSLNHTSLNHTALMYEYLDMLFNNCFNKLKFEETRLISNLAEQEKFKVITQAIHISITNLTDEQEIKNCTKVGLDLINEQQKILESEYTYDQQTGLRNFNYLSKLDDLFIDKNTLLMFLSINKMKFQNDASGHAHKNEVIVTFSAALQDSVRDSDVVIRYSEDEFIILCANAQGKVSNIIERIEASMKLKNSNIQYSFGWAYNLKKNFSETLESADNVMYINKKWMENHGRA